MKIEEVIIDGKKVNVVVDFDNDFIEKTLVDESNDELNLENTIDLSKTIEFVMDDLNG